MIDDTICQWADDHIEDIARLVLGEPDRHKSNKRELRWGSKGSFKIVITGPERGAWSDYEAQVDGRSVKGIGHLLGLPIEETERFIRDRMGSDYRPDPAKRHEQQRKAKAERERERTEKLEKAQQVLTELLPLTGTPGEKYWNDIRGIPQAPSCLAWRPCAFGQYGAVVVIATDRDGIAVGGQQIYVDAQGRKASVPIPKRSFGIIKGAAGVMPRRNDTILPADWEILAEGPETAGTVWNVIGARTLACLGSNFANAPVTPGSKIIIARDGDRLDAKIHAGVAKEIAELVAKGHTVIEAWPDRHYLDRKKTDFNDIRIREPEADEIIRQIFLDAVAPYLKSVQPYYPDQSLPPDQAKEIMKTAATRFFEEALAFKEGTRPAPCAGIQGSAGGGKSRGSSWVPGC
jgi:hypothetical protein